MPSGEEKVPIDKLTAVHNWTEDDVAQWLISLGKQFEVYVAAFKDNGVDGDMLLQLDERMLEESLGVGPELHKRKILLAVSRLKTGSASVSGAVGGGGVSFSADTSDLSKRKSSGAGTFAGLKRLTRSRSWNKLSLGDSASTDALVVKVERGLEFVVQIGIEKRRCRLKGIKSPPELKHQEEAWKELSRLINSKTITLLRDEKASTVDCAVVDAWNDKENTAVQLLKKGLAVLDKDETRGQFINAQDDAQRKSLGCWAPAKEKTEHEAHEEDYSKPVEFLNTVVTRVMKDFTFSIKLATSEVLCKLAHIRPPEDEAAADQAWREMSRMMNSKTFNLRRIGVDNGVWLCEAHNDKVGVSVKLCKLGLALPVSEDPNNVHCKEMEVARTNGRGMFFKKKEDVREAQVDDPDQLKVFENVPVTRVGRGVEFVVKIAVNEQRCRLSGLVEPDQEDKAEAARKELGRMINAKTITLKRVGVDFDGVWRCEVYVKTLHVNKTLVSRGWALLHESETRLNMLSAFEDAKRRQAGMFAEKSQKVKVSLTEEDYTKPKAIDNVLVTHVERAPFEFWYKSGIDDHSCKFRGIIPFDDEVWVEALWKETGRMINSKTVNLMRYSVTEDGDYIVDVFLGNGHLVQAALLKKGLCQLAAGETRTALVDANEDAKKNGRGFYTPVEEEKDDQQERKAEPKSTDALCVAIEGPIKFVIQLAVKKQRCKLRGVKEIKENVDADVVDLMAEMCQAELLRMVGTKVVKVDTEDSHAALWKVDAYIGDKNVAAELLKQGLVRLMPGEKSPALIQAEARGQKSQMGIWKYISGPSKAVDDSNT